MRISGSKEPPSFSECYQVACYNGPHGGQPLTSIQRLEEHFHYGICCTKSKKATILDAIKISLIISFSTSQTGWTKVANGDLTEKPDGKMNGWHAAVVEGYDFHGVEIQQNHALILKFQQLISTLLRMFISHWIASKVKQK